MNFDYKGIKVPSNGIEIYYEGFGKPTNPAVLLIMGLDAQCVVWSMAFIEPLVAAGYYVVRFDNRDIGLSSWLTDWNRRQPYTLEDMAADAVGLLDALNIKQAHIVGASMGGMIAQRMAISHSKRVLSLTSIMSSGHVMNPRATKNVVAKILFSVVPFLLKNIKIKHKLIDQPPTVKNYLATYRTLVGTKYPFNRDYFEALFTWSITVRKGQNPKARLQQYAAIVASGSRLKELPQIKAPTLVLHGTADKLVPPVHANIYAPLIAQAKLVWLEGVGHEMPVDILPQVHSEMLALFKRT